jgi:hypothetical protein
MDAIKHMVKNVYIYKSPHILTIFMFTFILTRTITE